MSKVDAQDVMRMLELKANESQLSKLQSDIDDKLALKMGIDA